MRRLWLALLILTGAFALAACSTEEEPEENGENGENGNGDPEPIETVDIYYLNDLHGAVHKDGEEMGAAYIANFLRHRIDDNPEGTFILAGGDMISGTDYADHSDGEALIHIMNAAGFDALAIGNHEFDYGQETLLEYFHPSRGIAEFPLLGANVIEEGGERPPTGIETNVIIERSGLRVGIIGTIEEGVDDVIPPSYLEGLAPFENPAPIVEGLARNMRNIFNVDIVLLLTHDRGYVNEDVEAFEEPYVDVIFNAHDHKEWTNLEGVPSIQSGYNGIYVGHVQLTLENNEIVNITMQNLTAEDDELFLSPCPEVEAIIEEYAPND